MKPHKIFPQEHMHGEGHNLTIQVWPFQCYVGDDIARYEIVKYSFATWPRICPNCKAKLTPENCEGYDAQIHTNQR